MLVLHYCVTCAQGSRLLMVLVPGGLALTVHGQPGAKQSAM